MRVLHFGEVKPHHQGKGTVADYALHVQCPWRLVGPDGVITGSHDLRVGSRENALADPDDARSGTVQDLRLGEWLGGFDEATRSHVSISAALTVATVSADPYGGLDIGFSDGRHLQLFPDGSVVEDWRFFASGTQGRHLVIEGGRIAEHPGAPGQGLAKAE
jgi:hypothetical protein